MVETISKYLVGCTNNYHHALSTTPPSPLREALRGSLGGTAPPYIPYFLLSQAASLCLVKKDQNFYFFFYGNLYKYVVKHLQTPDLKADMERELKF